MNISEMPLLFLSLTSDPPPIVEAAGVYELLVTDTVTLCSNTTDIEIVNGQQYPPLDALPPAPLTCIDSITTLSGSSPVPNLDFEWLFIQATDTLSLGNSATAQANQAGDYWFVAIDPSNGCTNAIPLEVEANLDAPTANAGAGFTLDCLNPIEVLDGTASIGVGALTYSWSSQNGNLTTGTNTATPSISLGGIYTLVVTDGNNGCTDSDMVEILSTGPSFDPIIGQPACYGDLGSINLSNVQGGTAPYLYSVNGIADLSPQNNYPNLNPGTYSLLVQDVLGCEDFEDIELTDPPLLELILDGTAVIQLGESYQILTTSTVPANQLASIVWNPADYLSCADCLNPVATPPQASFYELTVQDSAGCTASERLNIQVQKGSIYAPTVFDPGAATDNYIFTIFADTKSVVNIQTLRIFDRWGALVFENTNFAPNDLTQGWDGRYNGKMMNPAVFVWYAKVEYLDGSVELVKGGLTLTR